MAMATSLIGTSTRKNAAPNVHGGGWALYRTAENRRDVKTTLINDPAEEGGRPSRQARSYRIQAASNP